MEEVRYCLCGCGEIIKYKKSRFVFGHAKNIRNQKPPLCQCGCGNETKFDKWENKWNTFLPGHCSKVRTKETREKISKSLTGKHLSEECKKKISLANTGKKRSEETCLKISQLASLRKGELSPNYGIKKTEEHKRKIVEGNKGKIISEEMRKRLSEIGKTKTKEKNNNWKGGISPINQLVRNCEKYNYWKVGVFIRDDHSCQKCGSKKETEAHHIVHFNTIMINHNIQTLEEALNTQEFWNVDNGITLCKKCHKLEHKIKDQHDTTP